MKKYFYLLVSLLVAGCGFTSCGDDEPEPNPGKTDSLVFRQSTVKEGSEVDASEVNVITLSYNALVTYNPNANITLNGQKVQAKNNGSSRMAVDIVVSLESGMSYTLVVPSGSIVKTDDANVTAPELVLNFTTKKSGEQALPDNTAMKVTRWLGFGWNLGNHFDSYDGGNASNNYKITWNKDCPFWDSATPTEDLYQALATAGVNTVRIPVTWGPYEDMNDGKYTIEADYMALIKKNVLWAKAAGLNVVLNTHHDEYWQDAYTAGNSTETNDALKERISATWQQIAEAFKDEGEYLVLEAFNELNHNWAGATNREMEIQNEWNQLVVDVIRATGGQNATRWIAVPSYQASPDCALNPKFKLPTDAANKLIVAVHCYDPYTWTLAEKLSTSWGTETEKSNIVKKLQSLKTSFIDKDIPCYLGEFGCSLHETDAENVMRDYYLEYFCRAAHFAGLAATLWDNYNPGRGSEHHSYFDHNDGSWMENQEAIVKTMINAVTSSDPTYTLESIKKK